MVLDSPRVHAVPAHLAPDSSAGSSIDDEAGTLSPGKMGPANFELLRVVGQGAFGKVITTANLFRAKHLKRRHPRNILS